MPPDVSGNPKAFNTPGAVVELFFGLASAALPTTEEEEEENTVSPTESVTATTAEPGMQVEAVEPVDAGGSRQMKAGYPSELAEEVQRTQAEKDADADQPSPILGGVIRVDL